VSLDDEPETDPRGTRRGATDLVALVVLTILVPLLLRAANATAVPEPSHLSYLPAFEGPREIPFNAERLIELRRMNPDAVVIGDSMAGTRIDDRLLGRLSGRRVALLLQPGSGSVFWYLALRNWIIDSGIKPRVVFIFFRDTNLTDTMFRLDVQSLGHVAREREEEVAAIVESSLRTRWEPIHGLVRHAYQPERARRWLEPRVLAWPLGAITSSRRRQAAVRQQMNERFGLDRQRRMDAADVGVDPGEDFESAVEHSVLPLMFRDAERAGLTLCLVRVQRRPVNGRPPDQPGALRQYVGDLRGYVEAHGGVFRDDTGDPAMTLDLYEDGDHLSAQGKPRYTAIFYDRLRVLFQ
jgi:hypothetical protein